jgi:hypothetical protein
MQNVKNNFKLEIVDIHLKRSEYENKVVQLVKALLEIDQIMNQKQYHPEFIIESSEMKEAA